MDWNTPAGLLAQRCVNAKFQSNRATILDVHLAIQLLSDPEKHDIKFLQFACRKHNNHPP